MLVAIGYTGTSPDTESTNYGLEVTAEHLEDALERFAQFFVCPLFDAGAADREIRAVDSENAKNLQSDAWRTSMLLKSMCRPEHPYLKFGTGNLETLRDGPAEKGLDVREMLLDFYRR